MRSWVSLSAGAALALAALAGCTSTERAGGNSANSANRAGGAQQANATRPANTTAAQPQGTSHGEAARRVTAEEIKEAYNRGEGVVVDVRNETAYQTSHAKGAILIPVNDVAARAGELPRDKMILTYCT